MNYRNNRFNSQFKSFDAITQDKDVSKWRQLSDNGRGVREIERALDDTPTSVSAREQARRAACERLLFEAEVKLVESGHAHLLGVLHLIVRHGNDRRASIAALSETTRHLNAARKKYYGHRDELLRFFVQK